MRGTIDTRALFAVAVTIATFTILVLEHTSTRYRHRLFRAAGIDPVAADRFR